MFSVRSPAFLTWIPPYQSQKFIEIGDRRLGALNIILKLLIVGYIIGYSIIAKNGYQEIEPVRGAVSIKVKGTASNLPYIDPQSIFDSYDLEQPPLENDALFLTTHLYITKNQTKNVWPGNDPSQDSPLVPVTNNGTCTCPIGKYTDFGQISRLCVDPETELCYVNAWGPLEPLNVTGDIFNHVQRWTVYVKANIRVFDIGFTTAVANNESPIRGYNLFSIDDILDGAGTNYDAVKENGAFILGQIVYDCNLDQSLDTCNPSIQWSRLDTAGSPGFNYRYATRSDQISTGKTTRLLWKSWGVRVLFQVKGFGRRFSPIPLLIKLGAGAGLLAVSTVICDIIMTKLMNSKDKYNKEKFQEVEGPIESTMTLGSNDMTNSEVF